MVLLMPEQMGVLWFGVEGEASGEIPRTLVDSHLIHHVLHDVLANVGAEGFPVPLHAGHSSRYHWQGRTAHGSDMHAFCKIDAWSP